MRIEGPVGRRWWVGRRWLPWRPRGLWTAQILLVVVYTLIITYALPHLWLEPFGPVAKNIPILAVLIFLRQVEAPR